MEDQNRTKQTRKKIAQEKAKETYRCRDLLILTLRNPIKNIKQKAKICMQRTCTTIEKGREKER